MAKRKLDDFKSNEDAQITPEVPRNKYSKISEPSQLQTETDTDPGEKFKFVKLLGGGDHGFAMEIQNENSESFALKVTACLEEYNMNNLAYEVAPNFVVKPLIDFGEKSIEDILLNLHDFYPLLDNFTAQQACTTKLARPSYTGGKLVLFIDGGKSRAPKNSVFLGHSKNGFGAAVQYKCFTMELMDQDGDSEKTKGGGDIVHFDLKEKFKNSKKNEIFDDFFFDLYDSLVKNCKALGLNVRDHCKNGSLVARNWMGHNNEKNMIIWKIGDFSNCLILNSKNKDQNQNENMQEKNNLILNSKILMKLNKKNEIKSLILEES